MDSNDRRRATSVAIKELSEERLRAWRYNAAIDALLITDGRPHVTMESEVGEGVAILKDVSSGQPVGLRIAGLRAYLRSSVRGQGRCAGSNESAHGLIEMAVRVSGLGVSEPGVRVIGMHEKFDTASD